MNEEAARKRGQDSGRWLTAAGVLMAGGFLGEALDAHNNRLGLEGAVNTIFGVLGGAALGAILGAALTPRALRWLYRGSRPTAGRQKNTPDALAQPPAPSATAGACSEPSPGRQKMQLAAANVCLLVVLGEIGSGMGASLASTIAKAPTLKNGLDFWLFGMSTNLVEYSQWAGIFVGLVAGILASRHYNRRQSSLHSNP